MRREDRQRLIAFQQHWLPRLLQQQEEAYEVSTRVSSFSQRLAAEVNKAQSRLSEVMQNVMAPFQADDKDQDTYSPRPGSPLLRISPFPASTSSPLVEGFSALPVALLPSAEGLPDELSGLVASIQATNMQMRTLEESYTAIDSSLLVLQEGAELRDQQTAAYRDALLQLAEDIEQAEEEERQRAAEQARIEAELMRAAAEQRRIEEARREEALRLELQELVSAASAVQATQAGIAVAETSGQVLVGAPPIKVEVGVQKETKPGQWVVLVGGHPALGSWDVANALPMSWSDGHVWKGSVELPADTLDLQYKAVLCSNDKQVWEKGSNHNADLAGSCDVTLYHVFQA